MHCKYLLCVLYFHSVYGTVCVQSVKLECYHTSQTIPSVIFALYAFFFRNLSLPHNEIVLPKILLNPFKKSVRYISVSVLFLKLRSMLKLFLNLVMLFWLLSLCSIIDLPWELMECPESFAGRPSVQAHL